MTKDCKGISKRISQRQTDNGMVKNTKKLGKDTQQSVFT